MHVHRLSHTVSHIAKNVMRESSCLLPDVLCLGSCTCGVHYSLPPACLHADDRNNRSPAIKAKVWERWQTSAAADANLFTSMAKKQMQEGGGCMYRYTCEETKVSVMVHKAYNQGSNSFWRAEFQHLSRTLKKVPQPKSLNFCSHYWLNGYFKCNSGINKFYRNPFRAKQVINFKSLSWYKSKS